MVDDLPENTYILQELLQGNGLFVFPYNRARPALEWYKAHRQTVDLVITDLRLPEMSGQSLIIEIRKFEQEHRLRRVPIVVLTGEAAPTEKMDCLTQYGADEYLLKPTKLADLLSSVERLVTRKSHSPAATGVKKSVLIIDDDVVSQKFLSTVIRRNGSEVKSCINVKEAKREVLLNLERYDVILLDNQLRDGTGVDFMQYYCAEVLKKGVRRVPVVSMSGNAVQEQERVYDGFNMHGFLQKPISLTTLMGIIKSA